MRISVHESTVFNANTSSKIPTGGPGVSVTQRKTPRIVAISNKPLISKKCKNLKSTLVVRKIVRRPMSAKTKNGVAIASASAYETRLS